MNGKPAQIMGIITVQSQAVFTEIEIGSILIAAISVIGSVKGTVPCSIDRLWPFETQVSNWGLSIGYAEEEVLVPFG